MASAGTVKSSPTKADGGLETQGDLQSWEGPQEVPSPMSLR